MPTLPPADGLVTYLVGGPGSLPAVRPLRPYDELACDFLADLSSALFADAEAKAYPDVVTFAFWCRRANIGKLKTQFAETSVRLGLGLAFHITPSNVPTNFAFSFAFSLLAGNANIVRVPTKAFAQIDLVCRAMAGLFAEPRYRRIKDMTIFVRYERNDQVTAAFSALCQARLIWGGDAAINHIRTIRLPERARELAFADRYSFCILDAGSVNQADETALERLAQGFYNDVFLMDQNACSSPSLVVWHGAGEVVAEAKQLFWPLVHRLAAARYDLQPVNAIDKYHLLCREAVEMDDMESAARHGNYLYRAQITGLSEGTQAYRGRYGFVLEYDTQDIAGVAPLVSARVQTLTYFGIDAAKLADLVVSQALPGIDRIVPVGRALEVDPIWDGYDMVRSLSRIIDVQ